MFVLEATCFPVVGNTVYSGKSLVCRVQEHVGYFCCRNTDHCLCCYYFCVVEFQ